MTAPRTYPRRVRYGLTETEWQTLIDEAAGRCELCGSSPGIDKLMIDHDHSAWNKVRGLLCARCNNLIALIEAGKAASTDAARAYIDNAWWTRRPERAGRRARPDILTQTKRSTDA